MSTDSRMITIMPKKEDDGSHSVYLTVSGLTETESLTLADMLTEAYCGQEITKQ